jgi:hypothetical protein
MFAMSSLLFAGTWILWNQTPSSAAAEGLDPVVEEFVPGDYQGPGEVLVFREGSLLVTRRPGGEEPCSIVIPARRGERCGAR